jgi:hypothetical protein
MEKSTSAAACDVTNLILGAVLFLSPWLLSFASSHNPASWNAWIAGAVIVVLSIAALAAFAEWEEWLNLIVGLWVVISPWVLHFSTNMQVTSMNVIIGAIVAALAAYEIWLAHGGRLHVTQMR